MIGAGYTSSHPILPYNVSEKFREYSIRLRGPVNTPYDYGAPDFLYIFFDNSHDKCIIPIHEKGGEEFWEEIKLRKLFDPQYAIVANTSVSQYHCWPRKVEKDE